MFPTKVARRLYSASIPPRSTSLSNYRGIATHLHDHHAKLLSILPTNVDKSSKDYKENAAQMQKLTGRMHELHNRIGEGGPAKAREKHISRGKMLPRE